MPTSAILAPNARWAGRDQTGNPIVYGRLYTYKATTDIPKATFQDHTGILFNTNPVILDGKGEANIYWATDEYYRIELWTEGGKETGQLVYTQDNYPFVTGSGGNTNVYPAIENLIRNPQFSFWHNSASFPAYTTAANNTDYIADDWLFVRNNNNATINITRQAFNLGQTSVPASPIFYLRYECTNIGAGSETSKYFAQIFESVQTLAGTEISFALYAKSPTNSTITVSAFQDFGTGGTPSAGVETIILSANLTTSWQRYTGTIVIPNINGKTLGTNGDNLFRISLNMPLNAIATIDLCNLQLEPTNTITPFQYISQDQEFKRLNSQINYALFRTGDFKYTLRSVADPGWLMCNDSTIGSPSSNALTAGWYTKALYEILWSSIPNTYAPIYNADGTIGTRGTDADTDFNANKRLALTRTVGRVLASAGQAILFDIFTADSTTNLLTITHTANFYTGVPVTLTTTGTLPAPLALSTTYYVIAVDATHIKLATTLANALANTPIVLTNNGTGTHTIYVNYSNWVPGQYTGEESHVLTVDEMPSHVHSQVIDLSGSVGGANLIAVNQGVAPHEVISNINATGGNAAHNTMQPTLFLNCMIKL